MDFAKNLLAENVRLLKSEVSKTAYQGVFIAVTSIIVASMLVSYYLTNQVSLSGIIRAQTENYGLWILDFIPIVFGFWGQYSSSVIAYQAGAIIFDQTLELRTRAENLEKQASYSATHDAVTDLPNRVLFYDRVQQAVYAATQQEKMLAVLLVEVSNYKEIYDTLGRNSSDLVIKQVSTRLQNVVFGSNGVARLDGNIFSLLLSDIASEQDAVLLAGRIHAALDAAFMVDRLSVSVHSNIGIVHFPEHGEDVDTLVQRAGVALFMAAKALNGYSIYAPSFDENSPRRLTLMSELRQAIDKQHLFMCYQPKVSLNSDVLYGAEALIRWHHPKHGFISPEEFIPMAERTRMIKHVSAWVLKEAFRHCADWRRQGLEMTVSVNLSARDLYDPDLPDIIAGITASTAIEPSWVILEITESSIMNDPERTLEIIQRLHQMGYRFSIDDFGTGYSSLAYLKRMPLTELKIDKSFVVDLLHNENDAVIVNATINLAHNLGIQVTAEGVENQEALDTLKQYGCDIAQGYFIGKPMTFEAFNQWMQDANWRPKRFGV